MVYCYSEEDVGKTPQRKPVVIAVHGSGIFSSPERIEKAYEDNLTPNRAGKLSDTEIKDLLGGRLPDGAQIPIYSFSDFKKGIKELPRQYAVVLDFADAAQKKSGYQNADSLTDNPLFIVRAGGVEEGVSYIKRVKEKYGENYGNLHPFNNTDPVQPRGYLLFLGGIYDYGLDGNNNLDSNGSFVGVAAEPQVARENLVQAYTPEDVEKAVAELKALSLVVRPDAMQSLDVLVRNLQTN